MRQLLGLLFACVVLPAYGQDFSGRVIGITDGDTLTVLTPERVQVRVRLAEIDAPEGGQPYGNRSRQALSELAFQEDVIVVYVDTDQYGRTVGRIYVGDLDVSAEMIRQGAAWVYRDYVTDESLFAVETDARDTQRGLWGLSEARVPPWEWRRGGQATTVAPQAPQALPEPFTCGSKVYCRDMTSCDEARFYLTQCGVTGLDGDGDGVPCEAICR